MNKPRFKSFGALGAHILFILLFFLLIYPERPITDFPVHLVHIVFMAGYIFMIALPPSRWNGTRYIVALVAIVSVSALIRSFYPDYPDHRILWPMLYVLAVGEKKWRQITGILAIVTLFIIFFMMIVDGFSYGALLAAILLYVTLHYQSLLREAHRTNERQFEQLSAAYSELQQYSIQAMGYAALTERTRLARDIHDGLGHQLTSLIIQLQALRLMIPQDPIAAAHSVDELLKVARKGMEEIRLAVKEWSEDETGLGPIALKGLVSQTEANSLLRIDYQEAGPLSEWSVESSVILYRILQEALTNILKHAEANHVSILLKEEEEHVKLTIVDDGQFSGENALNFGFGLSGMMERCKSAGGSLTFSSNAPTGLRIEAVIPLNM
ncbi:sensor histidine kinase [Paenibacillus sp. HJGM_3]|uniref:sensor histidine kinase n=1 Tax=Paenibacillus sp. HJGM_3 TaxID=3379816 RepID=UPI0038662EE8